jgi:DNA replication protein DnaC
MTVVTMATREQLRALLGELNLKGMARALDDELDRAERQAEPAIDVLHRLLSEQASFQRERRLVYRVAQAHLPWPWTLDTFPFAKQPGVDRSQVRALAGLDFVRRAQNLVLIGPTGTGKTGIAIGLLRQACLNGYTGPCSTNCTRRWPTAAPPSCSRRCRACGPSSSTNSAT